MLFRSHKINPKRLTAMRRKMKKLAGRLSEKEFDNWFRSWFRSQCRNMSRQQRSNMMELYDNLKEVHYHVENDPGGRDGADWVQSERQ